jgi:hypothetical protein
MMMRVLLAAAIILTVPFVSRAFELTVSPIEAPEGVQKEPVSQPVLVSYLSLDVNGEIQKLGPEPTIKLGNGDPDLSVRAWLMATGDSLFLHADVTDDVFEQTFWGDDLWQGDSIQVAIDPLHDRTAGRYGHDDHEIGLTLSEKRPLVWRSVAPDRLDRGVVPDAELTVEREGNHTIYELRLPYNSVKYLSPSVFRYSGFTLAVNDSDTRGSRDGTLAWTAGISEGKNPAAFRSIIWPTMQLLTACDGAAAAIEQREPFAPAGKAHHFTLAVRSEKARSLILSAEVEGDRARSEFSVPNGQSWYDLALTNGGEDSARLTVRFAFMDETLGEFTVYRYAERRSSGGGST